MPPEQPSQSISKEQRPWLKYLWVVLVITIIFGGIYWYETYVNLNKKESMINIDSNSLPVTKRYSPEELGFSITTPPEWRNESLEVSNDVVAIFKYGSPDSEKSFTITVFGEKDPELLTLHEWSKSDATAYDPKTKADVLGKIGNNAANIYIGEVNGKIYKKAYLIRGVPKHIYEISAEMDKSQSWMSEFDQILASFKFFEPKTEKYVTHKNLQFSFEVTYPDTWRVREESGGVRIRNHYNPILDAPVKPIDINFQYLKDDNPKNLQLEEWLKVGYNSVFIKKGAIKTKIALGDEAIRSVSSSTPSSTGQASYVSYLIKNGKDIIQVSYLSKNIDTYVYDPDQIIKTLKFTKFDAATYSNLVNEENAKIRGEDKNNNGVWDDIETYIDQKYSYSAKMKSALTQYVKTIQQELLDYRDKEKSIQNANKSSRAVDCIYYILGNGEETLEIINEGHRISSDVSAQLLNTKERSMAYITYNGQLSGEFFGLSDYLISDCDFDPSKLSN